MLVERVDRADRLGLFFTLARGRVVGPADQRLQQLSGVVKIAAPQQGRAFTRQAVGRVGSEGVVGQNHAFGRWCAALRTPKRCLVHAVFMPMDQGDGDFRRGMGRRGGGQRFGRHGAVKAKEKLVLLTDWTGRTPRLHISQQSAAGEGTNIGAFSSRSGSARARF